MSLRGPPKAIERPPGHGIPKRHFGAQLASFWPPQTLRSELSLQRGTQITISPKTCPGDAAVTQKRPQRAPWMPLWVPFGAPWPHVGPFGSPNAAPEASSWQLFGAHLGCVPAKLPTERPKCPPKLQSVSKARL